MSGRAVPPLGAELLIETTRIQNAQVHVLTTNNVRQFTYRFAPLGSFMKILKRSAWLPVAVALSLVFGSIFCFPMPAKAATENIDATPNDLQVAVEKTAAAYDEATKKVEALQGQIGTNESHISTVKAQIPGQQEKSAVAMRTLYKFQQEGYSLVNMLLDAQNLDEFLTTIEYLGLIQQSNLDEMNRTKAMQDDLEQTQQELTKAKSDADAQQKTAEQALSNAQAAREAAHKKALEEAAAQAAQVEAAMKAAQAQAAIELAKGAEPPKGEIPVSGSVGPSDVNWSSDKAAFVNEWSGRIDNYLAGSPLAGQGKTFASASWDYGVDPRWSPAISNTESSKGLHCFRSHNAWGWGQIDWDSWEEAIDSHVRGLARGYGSTISYAAAVKYCPPNADHWYTATLAQMEMI